VQNLLLACRSEGLGCVLTTLLCLDEARVKQLLDIPDPFGTAACVPIGYPVGRGHGPLSRRPTEAAVHWDRWSG
jgi:nitroreductase